MDLHDALLAALAPRGLRERLQRRLLGGLTPVQLFHRLDPALQATLLAGPENGDVASRQALARIQEALGALQAQGALRKRTVPLQSQDGRGPRGVLVDVWRLV